MWIFRVAVFGAAVVAVASAVCAQTQAPMRTPGFTADQARRGRAFYSGNCSSCHGGHLDDGRFAPALKGEAHSAYWNGKTAEDLLNYMAGNMPPSQPGGLGLQAYADIYAFILQSAGAIPRDKELPVNAAALRGADAAR